MQTSSTSTEAIHIKSDKPTFTVKLAFLDVGQADTIIISCPETHEAIVVDCVDANTVMDYLEREQISYLRGVVVTHLHADHYKAVADLLNNYMQKSQEFGRLAFNEVPHLRSLQRLSPDADGHSVDCEQPLIGSKKSSLSSLAKLVLWCKENKSRCVSIKEQGGETDTPFSGTLAQNIRLVHPHHVDYEELKSKGLNNTSVVLHVIGSGSSALLTGDIEPDGWQQLQDNHPDLQCDVLKFPHHGGAWGEAETSDLLDTVKPSTVIISVGTDGKKYNHPNPEVFSTLHRRPDIRLLCTQATEQCQQTVHSERDAVINKFQTQSDSHSHQLILSKRGCPCAGTVIIELGEEARVIQPTIHLHHNIIKSHFKDHQCNLEQPATSVATSQLEAVPPSSSV